MKEVQLLGKKLLFQSLILLNLRLKEGQSPDDSGFKSGKLLKGLCALKMIRDKKLLTGLLQS